MNKYFSGLVAWLQAKFNGVSASEKRIMTAIDDLNAKVSASDAAVDKAVELLTSLSVTVPELNATIANLNELLGAQPNQDAALAAIASDLDAHSAKLAAAVAAATPSPAPVAEVTAA